MQVQQSIASTIGGPINDLGINGTPGFDPPPIPQTQNKHSDRIRRCPFPPGSGAAGNAGGLNAIVAQIMSLLQQLLAAIGGGGQGSGTMQPFFDTAQASSTGDPHLAFDGTSAGTTQQARFDSMDGHSDLLDSDSFQGGFRISTAVTSPDANGITSNRRADVVTDFGSTRVSLDNSGQARIVRNGKTLDLTPGQSVRLGANESVVQNGDGSLVISEDNATGGSITTTLRKAGAGVDVNVNAHSVDLGGDLVRHR
jgi:hypothetical protein